MLGSVAAGVYPNIQSAMEKMSTFSRTYPPNEGKPQEHHSARFQIFEQLQSVARQAVRF
jgi:ribulose kinase